MSAKTLFVAATVVGMLVACSRSNDSVTATPDAGGPRLDPRYTFPASETSRACAVDSDCVILPALSNCSSCCGDQAYARGEPERAYAAVVEACRSYDKEAYVCGMYCGAARASCFEGACVQLPDNDAGGPVLPAPVCPVASGSDAGAASNELGPGPACGARAVETGFEDALDPSWMTAKPEAVRIDRAEPVRGGGSLRISYRQENGAFLSIPQPNACAVRIAFTLRTRLLTTGLTLARVVAGPGSWFHLRLEGCSLTVGEETRSESAAGLGFGAPALPLAPDTDLRIVLTIDLRAKTISTTAAPIGEPLPAPQTSSLRGDPSGAGAISAIELGAAPGIQNSAVGTVWIDDLAVD